MISAGASRGTRHERHRSVQRGRRPECRAALLQRVCDEMFDCQLLLWRPTGRALVMPGSFERRPGFATASQRCAAQGWPILLRDTGGEPVPQSSAVLNIALACTMPVSEETGKRIVVAYERLLDPWRCGSPNMVCGQESARFQAPLRRPLQPDAGGPQAGRHRATLAAQLRRPPSRARSCGCADGGLARAHGRCRQPLLSRLRQRPPLPGRQPSGSQRATAGRPSEAESLSDRYQRVLARQGRNSAPAPALPGHRHGRRSTLPVL